MHSLDRLEVWSNIYMLLSVDSGSISTADALCVAQCRQISYIIMDFHDLINTKFFGLPLGFRLSSSCRSSTEVSRTGSSCPWIISSILASPARRASRYLATLETRIRAVASGTNITQCRAWKRDLRAWKLTMRSKVARPSIRVRPPSNNGEQNLLRFLPLVASRRVGPLSEVLHLRGVGPTESEVRFGGPIVLCKPSRAAEQRCENTVYNSWEQPF